MNDNIEKEIVSLHEKIKTINGKINRHTEYNMYGNKENMVQPNWDESGNIYSQMVLIENKLYIASKGDSTKENFERVIELYFDCKECMDGSDDCEYVRGLLDGSQVWSDLKQIANQLDIDYHKR